MLRHDIHKPINPRLGGFTLVEMVIGMMVLSIIGLVITGLFKTGIVATNFTLRQTFVLANSRKAIEGDGVRRGLIWAAQDAGSIAELSSATLRVNPSSGLSVLYYISGGDLLQSQVGFEQKQAKGITSLQVAYYSTDATGRIVQAASADTARLVTTLIGMTAARNKTYYFFSGGRLRNNP